MKPLPKQSAIIVWFKRDLRTVDHAPLAEGVKHGLPVIPLYVVEPEYWNLPDSSFRHWAFVRDSLINLREQLERLGQPLVVRSGNITDVLSDYSRKFKIERILTHEETGNHWTFQRDLSVIKWCKERSILLTEYPSNGVVRRLRSRDDWQKNHSNRMNREIIPEPASINGLEGLDVGEIPTARHPCFQWEVVGKVQRGGRSEALKVLDSFLHERASNYRFSISKPDKAVTGCSRLSPHITWGTLSMKEIFHATWGAMGELKKKSESGSKRQLQGLSAFVSRLYWHCHFMQKLEDEPEIEFSCMHRGFEGMRSEVNQEFFNAWHKGETGYPLVDACMRSLHQKGWLNFRMRAMVVSFAAYNLWLDWRVISPALARLFTDYEPGIHYSQLQMQSGVTGINTTRIYNPIKQSMDQDPEGNFIRKYVPELSELPNEFIHKPWEIDPLFQKQYSFKMGITYPRPIVDWSVTMREAKSKITERRKQVDYKMIKKEVLEKHASRKNNDRDNRARKRASVKNGNDRQMEMELG